jgi:hypothetical protein
VYGIEKQPKHIIMKFLMLLAFTVLVSCSSPENPAEASSTEEAKSQPATSTKPVAATKSPVFDFVACNFLTEAEVKSTLGDQITAVNFDEPRMRERRCQRTFTLTLANGTELLLTFSIEGSTVTGVDKLIKEYSDNARDIPGLIKMERASDGETNIATHISQRRLYLFRSGQEAAIALTYDVRGAQGGKTPEEVEARRQMGISLLEELLKG